ncbi:uncharacterized protein LOC119263638 isoform X2 [Pygocentrus nattereri]|uniref:uncharacterized protein LOC119263638 isoform X2 n=1 Tax=Pygocentrus nattereri TaxID=42514 RepID=UPI0018918912|nr:uncharacterized protein LOC119263638 isoform X2 [Pygocentrus nattereri]
MFSQSSVNIPAALILILLAVLQVKVDCKPAGQTVVKQTCSSTCWPEGNCYYSWYRYRYPGSWNREIIGCSYEATVWFISTSSPVQDRYCEVQNRAAPQQKCKLDWAVTYTPGRVCALKGSSVDLSCSYKHPEGLTVNRSLWYIESQWKFGAEPEDVRESDQYEGRVQYSRTLNSCRMTITDLRESDAHTYSFRFYTDHPDGSFSGSPGVTLSVTDLKVTVSDTDGGVKKLNCSSTCTLPNNPTYIWYRNGQPVSDQNRNELELRDRTVDAGSYSCAVKGYEELGSPAVYSPRPPSVSETEVNGSVTLVCVSDSNPASSYTWFRKTGGNITQFGEGASLTLAAGADGVFYCTAENPYGSSTSSEWTLTSAGLWKQFAVWGTVGVGSALVLSLITAAVCLQRKRGAEGGADVQAPKCGDDTYSALNPNTRSSDYDTLTQVRDSASDTYSALNSTTRSSDYDTLTEQRPPPAEMKKAAVGSLGLEQQERTYFSVQEPVLYGLEPVEFRRKFSC